ncbi:MAG TPA: alpha/beta hydrolase [Bryobacteraceae bacterium]|nr:alpha/beta hydrolase [Bryobacteraceae bacterium]
MQVAKIFLGLAILGSMAAVARTPVPAAESKPHTCTLANGGQALCATYPVWEDRDRKSGRKIGLNIAILPAIEKDHAPDPLFIFAGGPGQAATETTPGWLRDRTIRPHRDIVFIDQRGTGGSNPLECDFYGEPPDLQKVVSGTFPVDAIRACRQQLEKVADLRLYTTALAMDDYEEVRKWLGYGKINVWGGSYGTVAAQVYLRRHGENVRSVVLAAVAPVDELIPLHHAWAGQQSVDAIFAKCHADPACENAYPHLRTEFQSIFDRVRKGVEVEVHDDEGHTARVRPGVSSVADGIRHFLYYDDGGSFPSMIHNAAQGDLTKVVQTAVTAELGIRRVLSMGLNLSVTCAEDIPYIDDATLASATANTFLGDLRVQEQRAACRAWVRGVVPKDVHELVKSDVPVLFISGARDSVTPPSFAEHAATKLSHHLHVVFPEASHGNWGACGPRITAAFIEKGATDGLDVSCVGAQKPTQFTLPSTAPAGR